MAARARNPFSDFYRALQVQVRVLGALVFREMLVRYGRSQFGYMWAIVEPVGYVVALTIVFSFAGRPSPHGQSLPLFFALGIVPFKMCMGIASQLTAAMVSNQSLLTYPIVRELDTVLARFILEAVTSIVILAICLAGIWFMGDVPGPSQPLRMLEGLVLLMILGFGVGLTNACIVRHFASWQNIYRILTAPMIFISGIFYSMAQLPSEARDVVSWNPVIHGLELVREGYYSNYRATDVDAGYLFAVGLAFVVVGLFLERFYRTR